MIYQADMMHCRNERCKSKKSCYRFWLGKEAKSRKGLVSMFTLSDKVDKCELFLNIKNYENL